MADYWHKNAIIYAIDVGAFADADADGRGDFSGLINKLDYLHYLGVNCLWLLPFYPSPFRDNGYDVSDHYGVEPEYGTPGDFVEFHREAQDHGMRVIVDLVGNHTSDHHPWFRAARSDPDSHYRDFYVWAKDPPKTGNPEPIFPDVEESVWTYDQRAGMYYYHRFYGHEPDLNVRSPIVQAELHKIAGFWLELGVSGFRVDAAPHMIEPKGEPGAAHEYDHEILRALHRHVEVRSGSAVLLGETDVELKHIEDFFAGGEGLHMIFNFILDNALFLALARRRATPIADCLGKLPKRPGRCQYATFVRNLDELDLERLSDAEREEVYAAFAPDERMRIFGRGIRRRLAPMLGGNRPRIEVAQSLLFTLPGSPVLVYGDEIGMGEDLSLDGRNSVRTPMQWDATENAGFSRAPPGKLIRPVVSRGPFSYEKVNVQAQTRDPESLLNRVRRMILMRKLTPEFGWGEYEVLETGNEAVLAHRCEWEGRAAIAVHNLDDRPAEVDLEIGDGRGGLVELNADRRYADRRYADAPKERGRLMLGPYGYRWFRIGRERRGALLQ